MKIKEKRKEKEKKKRVPLVCRPQMQTSGCGNWQRRTCVVSWCAGAAHFFFFLLFLLFVLYWNWNWNWNWNRFLLNRKSTGLFSRSSLFVVLVLDFLVVLWHWLRTGTMPLLLHFVEEPRRASVSHLLIADAVLVVLHVALFARTRLRVRLAHHTQHHH